MPSADSRSAMANRARLMLMRVADRVPVANRLLAALPRAEYRRLLADLEPVTLAFGEILYEPGDAIRHVYFPNDSLVSLITLADHQLALEVGMPVAFLEVVLRGVMVLIAPPLSSSPGTIASALAPWSQYTVPGIILSVT